MGSVDRVSQKSRYLEQPVNKLVVLVETKTELMVQFPVQKLEHVFKMVTSSGELFIEGYGHFKTERAFVILK